MLTADRCTIVIQPIIRENSLFYNNLNSPTLYPMRMPIIKKLICLFLVAFTLQVNGQTISTWTAEQVANASTANEITYLTSVEKEAVMYINLARLYPKLF